MEIISTRDSIKWIWPHVARSSIKNLSLIDCDLDGDDLRLIINRLPQSMITKLDLSRNHRLNDVPLSFIVKIASSFFLEELKLKNCSLDFKQINDLIQILTEKGSPLVLDLRGNLEQDEMKNFLISLRYFVK